MSITDNKLKLIINKNNFEKLETILKDNPDYIITDDLIYYTISKKHIKCFDILLNHPKIYDLDCSYIIAFEIYNKAKNEDNKYYISKLLDKNYNLDERILSYLVGYDIDLFNKHLNMHINDYEYIEKLLLYLSFNKNYLYFIDLFNNRLSKEQQISFARTFYTYEFYIKNDKVFSYLMDSKDFNYKAITTNEEYIVNNMFTLPIVYCSNNYNKLIYINFLLKNPIDFNYINNEDTIINFLKNILSKDILCTKYSTNIYYKNKCIINSPKINIIKIQFKHFGYRCQSINTLYELYNLGLNIDVYGDITNEDILNYFNNYNMNHMFGDFMHKMIFIWYVQFANLINQSIPNHLVDTINNLYNNSELLNEIYDLNKNVGAHIFDYNEKLK